MFSRKPNKKTILSIYVYSISIYPIVKIMSSDRIRPAEAFQSVIHYQQSLLHSSYNSMVRTFIKVISKIPKLDNFVNCYTKSPFNRPDVAGAVLQTLFFLSFFYNGASLVVGGSLIDGTYTVQFLKQTLNTKP